MKSNLSIISFMDHAFGIEFKKLLSHLGLSRFSPILSSRIFIVFIVLYFTFREGNGNPLQYPCLENHMDGGAWWAAVHGVSTSWTPLSDFTFAFHFHAWRRKWQPTPVFLPGESQGSRSLMGCRLWGRTESDTTEAT